MVQASGNDLDPAPAEVGELSVSELSTPPPQSAPPWMHTELGICPASLDQAWDKSCIPVAAPSRLSPGFRCRLHTPALTILSQNKLKPARSKLRTAVSARTRDVCMLLGQRASPEQPLTRANQGKRSGKPEVPACSCFCHRYTSPN